MPTELICAICRNRFSVRPSRIAKGAKYCSYQCHQVGEGVKGGRARGQQMRASSRGKSYRKVGNRHEHRALAEEKLGRRLKSEEIVHHRDGDRFNNHPDNLEIMTQAEHIREHLPAMLKARREKHGY